MAKKQAVSKPDPSKATLVLSLFDGAREPVPDDTEVLIRILDGNQKKVFERSRKGASFNFSLPFQDGIANNYTVLASPDQYQEAGAVGIRLSPKRIAPVSLMLLAKEGGFSFAKARWEAIALHPAFQVLSSGASSPSSARDRYEMLLDSHAASGACLWNVLTAAGQLSIGGRNAASFLKRLTWDDSMAQDRCFGFADKALIDWTTSAPKGTFQKEPNPGKFHAGATLSYKETRFNEANLQITFHESATSTIDGVDCVKVELDLDYFKDILAHGLFEVLPNKMRKAFEGPKEGLSDPSEIYRLRWMAAANLIGTPAFDPPFVWS